MSAFSLARVRRSLIYFTLGKGLGIILGIGLLLILVRVLEVNDYKFYLISQAFLIIVNQFSSLGIEQTAQRYLPELLSRSEGLTLYKLTGKLCYLRIIVLLIIAALIYPFINSIADLLNIQSYQYEFKLFLLVVVFELFARFMDIVFESFMLQGISQISMLLRAGFRLLPIIWLIVISGDNHIELEQWILIDISASIIGCIWGIINLWKYLKEISQTQPGNNNPIEYIRYSSFSFPIYIAGTIMLLSSQDTIKLIAANILNSVDFASFGFAATLVYMLNRYLPMTLLVGMLRPLLVDAREKPDYQVRLPKIAGLLFKLNMFTLMPIIAFVFVFSEEISLLLTGGRYPDAANYMLAFIPILILQTLRFITSLTALAMEGARVTLVATVLSLTGLFSGVMLSHYIDGYGLCVGLAISNLIFSVWIIKKLRKTGLVIDYQVASYMKLLITSIMAMVSMIIIETILQMNLPLLLVVGVLEISIFYLIVTYLFKPFQEYERDILNKILKRKVFVW